jgi:uncharacterized membrane protein YqjE
MSGPTHAGGLFASLRRLLGTVLEIAEVRLALLSTEVELEKRRLFDALLWAAVAMLVLATGLTLFCAFVILLFSEGYRLAALGVMALLFLGGGLLLLQQARQRLRSPDGMLAGSLAELQRDRDGITGEAVREQT